MGLFDNNIHMNGAGTTYQAFLDLADAAEEKGGQIGDRTVRLVKAGDGLATTTSRGTKGARAAQIADARSAFLLAIAREFGYAARSIAEKTLGTGENAVPLTARTIRAVNQALGDKDALAADSALIREFKVDFDIEVGAARQQLQLRMGAADADFDRAKIQAEVLKLVKDGKYPGTKDGMRAAIREVAAMRVVTAARMESLLLAKGVPQQLAGRLAEKVLDKAVAVVDDYTVPSGDAVNAKLDALAAEFIAEDRDAIAALTVSEAETLLKTMFGRNALQGEDAQKAIGNLKAKIDNLKADNLKPAAFKAGCEKAFQKTVKAHAVREIAQEMAMADSDNPAYGRIGVRLYDALGVGNGEKDRAVTDFSIWKLTDEYIAGRLDLSGKSPEEMRRQAAKLVFTAIAEDYAGKLPKLADEHPQLADAKGSTVRHVAAGLVERFGTAVTDQDFAQLAADFKTRLSRQFDRANTTLKNIDLAADQAKGELEGRLEQLAGQHGIPLTQGIRDMLAKTFDEAADKLKSSAPIVDKALTADECKAAILDRIEKKWLGPCRQAAAEIEASALDPAQKKAFLAKVMGSEVNVAHVKMALKTVGAFDARELIAAAKAGDGKKFAGQFYQFVTETYGRITDKAERQMIDGADDYAAFVGTAAELLSILNPGIGDAIRGLDAEPRAKMFDDAVQTSIDASRETQKKVVEGLDKKEAELIALDARFWSSATSCSMQLQEAIG